MYSTAKFLVVCSTLALLVTGYDERNAGSSQAPTARSPATTSSPAADNWLGKWNGPEGTFLQLIGGNGKYDVTIQNLDGPRIFQGKAVDDRIDFDRDGMKQSLRATNGEDTGMKWLSDKSHCLTVRAGEGYCRD